MKFHDKTDSVFPSQVFFTLIVKYSVDFEIGHKTVSLIKNKSGQKPARKL